ncbi:Late embryogenesis abundant protein LEA_2 subgroup [Arabidopsis thaliana x Arabidopsis arenosa]|uniref:Late embryogenesis abundant protein LEA_2 subgroup n=1 Tax=Arabidopsis thaliana x Arabidopsis arenosa TaxID=1240361 RepID=A0A8T1Y3N6_9BRAS|nr:Late embryogenesis abundant protein LEA_2 subgroup [Arabidopsis thaliana x Arabidopsis arenosa]
MELAMAKINEDQTKPLAPLTPRSDQPDEDQYHGDRTKYVHSQTKLILCCGFIASLTMLIAVTFIVLSLTVFHLHNPNLTVHSISFIQPLDFVNGKVNTNRNATVSVEISLHNPNPALFKVKNVNVSFYHGELVVVGESIRRSETIPAKRTVKMNLAAEIDTTKLLASLPGLMEDINGRGVDLKSSVEVKGRVKLMKIFKRSVHLQTDCFMKMTTNNFLTPTFQCFKTHEMPKNRAKSKGD